MILLNLFVWTINILGIFGTSWLIYRLIYNLTSHNNGTGESLIEMFTRNVVNIFYIVKGSIVNLWSFINGESGSEFSYKEIFKANKPKKIRLKTYEEYLRDKEKELINEF